MNTMSDRDGICLVGADALGRAGHWAHHHHHMHQSIIRQIHEAHTG